MVKKIFKIDNKLYAKYLLQLFKPLELKYTFERYKLKSIHTVGIKKAMEFIMDSLSDVELEDLIKNKELEVLSREIESAFRIINKKSLANITILDSNNHELELEFKPPLQAPIIKAIVSINKNNINHPEADV